MHGTSKLRTDRAVGVIGAITAGTPVTVTYTSVCMAGQVTLRSVSQVISKGWRFPVDANGDWDYDPSTATATLHPSRTLGVGQQQACELRLVVEAHHPSHIEDLPAPLIDADGQDGPAAVTPLAALAAPPVSPPALNLGDPGQSDPTMVAVGVANGSPFPILNTAIELDGPTTKTRHDIPTLEPGARTVFRVPIVPDGAGEPIVARVVYATNQFEVPIPAAAFAQTLSIETARMAAAPPAHDDLGHEPSPSHEDVVVAGHSDLFDFGAAPVAPVSTGTLAPVSLERTGHVSAEPTPSPLVDKAGGTVDVVEVSLADTGGPVGVGDVIEVVASVVNGEDEPARDVTVIAHLPATVTLRDDRWVTHSPGQVARFVEYLPPGHGVPISLRVRLDKRTAVNIRFEVT